MTGDGSLISPLALVTVFAAGMMVGLLANLIRSSLERR